MPNIVAELHVEVAVENGGIYFRLMLLGRQRRDILEDIEDGLTKYPSFSIITWYHSHADTQIAVAAENIYGTAEPRSLRPGDVVADQERKRWRQEEKPRVWPHLLAAA